MQSLPYNYSPASALAMSSARYGITSRNRSRNEMYFQSNDQKIEFSTNNPYEFENTSTSPIQYQSHHQQSAAPTSAHLLTSLQEITLHDVHLMTTNYTYSKQVGNYLIGRTIGNGSFATVNEAGHVLTGERVAMKCVDKNKCLADPYIRQNLRREGQILEKLHHTNVIQLYEVLETERFYYLGIELCHQNLMMKIVRCEGGRLSEPIARGYMRQLLIGLKYIHEKGIMHRDLKIENILLTDDDRIKISDFGVSIQLKVNSTSAKSKTLDRLRKLTLNSSNDDEAVLEDVIGGCECNNGGGGRTSRDDSYKDRSLSSYSGAFCKTQCGSPAYAAPEVLAKKKYSYPADVWSLGVDMFAMLTGILPFTVKPYSITRLHEKMINKDINKTSDVISKNSWSLIYSFLEPNPELRITLLRALQHNWITDDCQGTSHSNQSSTLSQKQLSRHPENSNYNADKANNPSVVRFLQSYFHLHSSSIAQHLQSNKPSSILSTYYLMQKKYRRLCRKLPFALQTSLNKPRAPDHSKHNTLDRLQSYENVTLSSNRNNPSQKPNKDEAVTGQNNGSNQLDWTRNENQKRKSTSNNISKSILFNTNLRSNLHFALKKQKAKQFSEMEKYEPPQRDADNSYNSNLNNLMTYNESSELERSSKLPKARNLIPNYNVRPSADLVIQKNNTKNKKSSFLWNRITSQNLFQPNHLSKSPFMDQNSRVKMQTLPYHTVNSNGKINSQKSSTLNNSAMSNYPSAPILSHHRKVKFDEQTGRTFVFPTGRHAAPIPMTGALSNMIDSKKSSHYLF